ncbi:MAG: anti-sigma factor [Candidatus Eremiobacteraeota bacterium]|nr:anti-sigma factor [Candidatus Eremiobacteraeota bacterium]
MSNVAHTPEMLDDVAVYALGALPLAAAKRVREHIDACDECAQEYALLAPVTSAVGASASTTGSDASCPGALLKPRIMATIRAHAAPQPPVRFARPPVWPAYLVAAACFAIAILASIWNVVLAGQLKQAQSELASISSRTTSLARNLSDTRATLSDLLDTSAQHYSAGNGEIVAHGSKLYLAMHALPEPPRGRVYQAWTLAKGAKRVAPSVTFVPDAHGVAVIPLSVDARATAAVAVSVEPEGGSKQPTTKPILLVPLT